MHSHMGLHLDDPLPTCRVNTYNGRAYKNDPTIFAWDMMNEPRCLGCADSVQAWIDEMAPYFKSIDTNHMVRSSFVLHSKGSSPWIKHSLLSTCLQANSRSALSVCHRG